MAIAVEWFELYPESRSSTIDRSNISKDFSFLVQGEFTDGATEDDFGTNDDVEVQKAVFAKFAPLFYMYYYSDTESYTLYFASCAITQLNWNQWKVTLSYDIPSDGGQSQGGGGGNIGPSFGENNGLGWSQEFTQVSFDTTPALRIELRAKVLELKYRIGDQNLIPDMSGKIYPVGKSDDEIAGREVYEPAFKFTVIQYRPPSKIKYAYARKLSRLAGRINDKVFFGFPPKSVLFLGTTGQGDMYKNVPLSYSFEVRNNFILSTTIEHLCDPNEEDPDEMYDIRRDLAFPDSEPGIIFSGWCTIEYRFKDIPSADNKKILPTACERWIFAPPEEVDFDTFDL